MLVMGGPAQLWAARSADKPCSLDTSHLCAGHEAWPSPPTHFQTLSCQKQRQLSALQRESSGGKEALKEASVDWSAALPRTCLQCVWSWSVPRRLPLGNPPTDFLRAPQPPCLCSPTRPAWAASPCPVRPCTPLPVPHNVLFPRNPLSLYARRDQSLSGADSTCFLCPSLDNESHLLGVPLII